MNHFKVNNSVVFSTSTMLCSDHLYPKYFRHSKVNSRVHSAVNPQCPLPPPLGTKNTLLLVSVGLPFPKVSHKQNHRRPFVSFMDIMFSRLVQAVASTSIHSFLQSKNIPLCIYTSTGVSSPHHGPLGCFHPVAIVKRAASNTQVAGFIS